MANNDNGAMRAIFHGGNKGRIPNPGGGMKSPDPKFKPDPRIDSSGNYKAKPKRAHPDLDHGSPRINNMGFSAPITRTAPKKYLGG